MDMDDVLEVFVGTLLAGIVLAFLVPRMGLGQREKGEKGWFG